MPLRLRAFAVQAFHRTIEGDRMIRRIAVSMASALLLLTGARVAAAQEWPTKPIRFVIPFAQGGLSDLVLALTKGPVEERLGQRIVVETRPGAGGNVGMQSVLAAPADGYTIAVAPSNTITINQHLFKSMPFDGLRDFVPVTMLVDVPLVLSVSARHPVTTLREFIEHAKAHPGKVNYGSPGPATPPHLAAALLAQTAGLDTVHVPYKGGNAAGTGLVANEVQYMVIAYASLRGQIQGSLVRPIAVAAGARVPALPDTPTFAEAGYADLQKAMPRSWWGLVAARGTPEPAIRRLQEEFRAALHAPAAQAKLRDAGLVPVGSSPAEFGASWPDESARWAAVIREMGLKLE